MAPPFAQRVTHYKQSLLQDLLIYVDDGFYTAAGAPVLPGAPVASGYGNYVDDGFYASAGSAVGTAEPRKRSGQLDRHPHPHPHPQQEQHQQPPPPLPTLPQQWNAVCNLAGGGVSSLPWPEEKTIVVEDGVARRTATRIISKFPLAPMDWIGTSEEYINITTYTMDNFTGLDVNGGTLAVSQLVSEWSSMWSWLHHANYTGIAVVNSIKTHTWEAYYPNVLGPGSHLAYNASFKLDNSSSSVPVTYYMDFASASQNYTQDLVFSTFAAGVDVLAPDARDIFASFNVTDYTNPATCSSNATTPPPPPPPLAAAAAAAAAPATMNQTMYIFHPATNFDIQGQDLGNSAGDVLFTCLDVLTQTPKTMDHAYAWITQWTIEMVPTFGQYQNCNGYNPPSCYGVNDFWVGREAAEGTGG
eukprot:gene4-11307_t